jgi:TRAP-type C4-dicarboxylate transport system permease large subunit
VLKGTIPFFIGDLTVLVLCMLYPGLSTWLPNLLITDVFK